MYEMVAKISDQRIKEVNALLELCSGKPWNDGNVMLVHFTLNRIFGSEKFMASPEDHISLGETYIKMIVELQVSFLNGLKR
jgi:hypothetical protein